MKHLHLTSLNVTIKSIGSEENSVSRVRKTQDGSPSVLPQMHYSEETKPSWMLQLDCVLSLLELLTFAPDKHCFPVRRQRLQIQLVSGK